MIDHLYDRGQHASYFRKSCNATTTSLVGTSPSYDSDLRFEIHEVMPSIFTVCLVAHIYIYMHTLFHRLSQYTGTSLNGPW